MTTQTCIRTRRMLARDIYKGLKILIEGEFYTVTSVENGEYCGQKVIEADFDIPEGANPYLPTFYWPGEAVEVHPSANQVYCI